ncbi:N-acetylmuramic acid 6-phosphate etherase [Sphingomonas sp. MAH-20]|uniref:N-acetylmuramic acid 6-phosphate etherase n=1 Tax=Sphingomonas horti TaxID=2682842 RepID=A0A6I4IWK4_9SPHN|nr:MULTISPECIES: N-acetylmuramic acid 6-phosphate etherase [Sphingomonas]MBA2920214.1 N-acetylmuramic acid 6-phosphate etherase [Sphingomonas sp. CGMCC 1.13658]MVO76469.1 N-acetylmuramic acid 6-phosphate etherase [Sphingomonas horti]
MSTEWISPRYADLDLWPTHEAVAAMLEGQLAAAAAAHAQSRAIADAADAAAHRLRQDGRLIYAGAGTSGRLAVLDGVELGPTFDWDRTVYALAGGMGALLDSVEGAEDDAAAGEAAIREASPTPADVMIGVAASGRTPFTLGALRAAAAAGALTIGLASNAGTPLLALADHAILLETGPEVVAGSTRMKAGTAQKIALNILSTAIMLRLDRIHAGLMVDMRVSNAKLRVRAATIVSKIAETDLGTAEAALVASRGSIKRAVLIARGIDEGAIETADGNLRQALRR